MFLKLKYLAKCHDDQDDVVVDDDGGGKTDVDVSKKAFLLQYFVLNE